MLAQPWRAHVIDNTSKGADGVRLLDANADGLLDIVTGWEQGGLVRLYINPGPTRTKQPWPAVTVGSVASPEDAVMADLDGDGAVDVVSATEGKDRTIYVHWAPKEAGQLGRDGAWTTEPIPATKNQQQWMFTLPMQVDAPRDEAAGIDLIVGSKGENASIGWLQSPSGNARDLAAWKYHRLYDAGWIMSLIAIDMDFDGDLDVLASDRKGANAGVLWLENPGPAATTSGGRWEVHRLGPRNREIMFIDAADLEGDSRFDIIAPAKPHDLIWLRRTVEGNWMTDTISLTGGLAVGHVKSAKAADVDGDGRPDLIVSFEGAQGEARGVVWLKHQRGRWAMHDISGESGVKFDLVAAIDLDDDGDLDLITCEENENLGLIWYENPTRKRIVPEK